MADHRITGSWEHLVEDAAQVAKAHLHTAIDAIDAALGADYAAAHPGLVAAFIDAAGRSFNTSTLAVCLQALTDVVANMEASDERTQTDSR